MASKHVRQTFLGLFSLEHSALCPEFALLLSRQGTQYGNDLHEIRTAHGRECSESSLRHQMVPSPYVPGRHCCGLMVCWKAQVPKDLTQKPDCTTGKFGRQTPADGLFQEDFGHGSVSFPKRRVLCEAFGLGSPRPVARKTRERAIFPEELPPVFVAAAHRRGRSFRRAANVGSVLQPLKNGVGFLKWINCQQDQKS